MATEREKLISRAQSARRESKQLDFKSVFDPVSAEAWCELIKDIVAFANSGGGIVVFGVENDGRSLGGDPAPILACDIADITNKIFKYTNHQFADIEIVEIERDAHVHAAFLASNSNVPLVFTKPGTYDVGGGRQKTAFGQGSLYFRHGAKSEPGNHDDLVAWRDREIKRVRREWVRGIRKVVEAPEGHAVAVVPADSLAPDGSIPGMNARITADPRATTFVPRNAEELWPHRQKELLRKINQALPHGVHINGHDILCANQKLDVLNAHPEFAYKPHKLASSQYSDAYADWLVGEATKDHAFFSKIREEHRNR